MLDKINKPGKKQEALPLLPKQIRNYNDSFYRFNPKEVQQQWVIKGEKERAIAT